MLDCSERAYDSGDVCRMLEQPAHAAGAIAIHPRNPMPSRSMLAVILLKFEMPGKSRG